MAREEASVAPVVRSPAQEAELLAREAGSQARGVVCRNGCGPDMAQCCNPGIGCASPNGPSCECGPDFAWHCYGGTGGTGGGCVGTRADPDLAQCLQSGSRLRERQLRMNCEWDMLWHCKGGTGRVRRCLRRHGLRPEGVPCCYRERAARRQVPTGSPAAATMIMCGIAAEARAVAQADPPGATPQLRTTLLCCGSTCVYEMNDPMNCSGCASMCASLHPYCSGGICSSAPCFGTNACTPNEFCCGASCCSNGQLCCDVQGPGPTSADLPHTHARGAHVSQGLPAVQLSSFDAEAPLAFSKLADQWPIPRLIDECEPPCGVLLGCARRLGQLTAERCLHGSSLVDNSHFLAC